MAEHKRKADEGWLASDAKTQAVQTIPSLNNDCIRAIMELALGQRTLATYGADGRTVVESRDYYGERLTPRREKAGVSIHTLRRVCRKWERIASSLVRTAKVGMDAEAALILRIPSLFPNVVTLKRQSCREVAPVITTVCNQLRANRSSSSTVFLPPLHKSATPYERIVQTRDGRSVKYVFVNGTKLTTPIRSVDAYVFNGSCKDMVASLNSMASDGSNAVILIYLCDPTFFSYADVASYTGDPESRRELVKRARLEKKMALERAFATVPEQVRNRVQIHYISTEFGCAKFIRWIQPWFARPTVFHTYSVEHARSTTVLVMQGGPRKLYRDADLYCDLWDSHAIAAPLI